MRKPSALLLVCIAAALAACDREKPQAKSEAPPVAPQDLTVSLVNIVPGGGKPVDIEPAEARKFDGNPEAIAAGRQLFQAYNCVGCHFNGGGGMGPALMDDKWIYGSSMQNIASTIIEGRPNGMPTFRGMVSGDQVWQLAAYVRSLSNLGEKSEAKGKETN
jgi:cytochrome c oxidase cbb3-type subunit 3